MKHFNILKQLLLPLAIMLAAIPALAQPLNGVYTIGGTSPNYTTLSAAVTDLNTKGVSGPVTFNIRPGSYSDFATITAISGSSAVNRVTFKSETNNAADVTITGTGSSVGTNDHVFRLTNASYVSIKHLTMVHTNSSYGNGVIISGGASNDSVTNCVITLAANTTSTYVAHIQMYGPQYGYISGSNFVFNNNTFNNGAQVFYIYGNGAGGAIDGIVADNNVINGPYYAITWNYYTKNFKFRGNTVNLTSNYTSFYGLYSAYSVEALQISNNTFTGGWGGGYLIYPQYTIGSPTQPAKWGRIENNVINVTANNTGTLQPYYNYQNDFLIFKNNTITVSATTNTINLWNYYSHNQLFEGNTYNLTTTTANILHYHYYGSNTTYKNNTYNFTNSGSGTIYGCYQVNSGSDGGTFIGNKYNLSSTSGTIYGVYNNIPNTNFTNNTWNVATSGAIYAYYPNWSTGTTKFHNNTVYSRGTGSTNYTAYLLNGGGMLNIRNSVFAKTSGTGVGFYMSNNAYVSSDYNNIYQPSGTFAQRVSPSGISATTLQAWRNGGNDLNSISFDPGVTSTTNVTPDPNNPNSWSLNGRGVHIAGNNADINGNVRITAVTDGVPDIGAYEFTPVATPPAAVATPAVPAANGTQIFTFGQDTVATIAWGPSVPASVTVRQYTGTQPPSISTLSANRMYFYSDISIPSGTYAHTSNLYYKDPWMGTVAGENALRLAKKDGANPWVGYAAPASIANTTRNIISTTGTNNFGLHTGIDQGDNAGTNAVVNPVKPFCTGNQTVSVQIKNSGNNVLNNVQIGWTVDGVAQTPVSYNTPINPLGSGLGNTATVNLGNVLFGTAPRTIRAWTFSPNGNVDNFKTDDTVTVVLRSSLNGTYTVGGTTPDYATIAAAVNDLNLYGVCGPVWFNLRNGTYTAQTVLKPVVGASAINRITFQSETQNAANVIVTFAATSSTANYTLKFDSAAYFTFNRLTLRATNTTNGRVIEFAGNASNDSIVNSIVEAPVTTSTSNTIGGVYIQTPYSGDHNVIASNSILNGSFGIYYNGTSSYMINNHVVANNTFNNQFYWFTYNYYANNFKLIGNLMTSSGSTGTYHYGLYAYYTQGNSEVRNNTLNITKSTGTYIYGLYNWYTTGDGTSPASWYKFSGNTFNFTTSGSCGIYLYTFYQPTYDSMANNTFNLTSNGTGYIYGYYGIGYMHTNAAIVNNTWNITLAAGSSGHHYTYGVYTCSNTLFENNNWNMNMLGSGYCPSCYWVYSGGSNVIARKNTFTANCTNANTNPFYNMASTTGASFIDNTINLTSTTGGYYNYYNSNTNGLVRGNKININSTTGLHYAMYASSNNSTNFINNLVRSNTTGTAYAGYFLSNTNVKVYNNVFHTAGATGSHYGGYFQNTGSPQMMTIRNNVFSKISSAGYALYNYNHAFANSDFNNLYTANGTSLYYAQFPTAGVQTTLQAIRNMNTELNSIVHDPGFTSSTNLQPDATNPASWSLQGRGEHASFNTTDINGNTRVTTKGAGVPDIGAYEFTPSVLPPDATAIPAAPTAGSTQYFLFGQDTVAAVDWAAASAIPASINVKQHSGIQPPSFIAGTNAMYIYTDIAVPSGTYAHNTRFYYKDPQTGSTIGEAGLRLAKKDGTNPWVLHSSPQSSTDPVWNKNNTNNLTTFGYFTLTDVPNNASAAELVSPVGFFCSPATHPVKVKIKNNGNNNINSVWVGFTINGTPGTPVQHNSTIYTLGSPQGNEATVTITNYNFTTSAPISFVVYTYSPNGQTDPAPADDTIKFVLRPGLNGIYTVGGVTPDYPTVDSAVKDVNKYGVCGPVTFNIRAGNYTAPPAITTIQGSSNTNRVTFQAENGIASGVVITATPTVAANNYVFQLNGASYVTLRNLTLSNTSASFGTVISYVGSTTGDTIVGCTMNSLSTTTTSTNNAVIYGNGNTMINCGIVGNAINNGSAGMYFTAGGSNNLIEENTVTNPYYYGMLLQGLNGLKLRNNNINIASASSYYALYLYNINNAGTTNVEITGNAINTAGYGYPLFWQNTSATASARAQFANNKLNVNSSNYIYGGAYLYNLYYCDIYNNDFNVSTTNGYAYGIYGFYAYNCKIYNNVVNTNASLGTSYSYMMYYGSYDTVYNNTFIMRGTNSSYAGYVYTMYSSYPGHMYRNNVYANLAGGTALYLYDAMNNGITSHDYNNIWTSGSSFVTGYATYNTLQAYRTGSGFDRNSLSYDPGFMSNTDPHPDPNNPASWSLNGRGIHLPWNTLDKEGNPRVTTLAAGVPDIGAYEFVPNTTPPLAVATPATPAVGKQVFTFGQDTVAAITWKPNTQIPNTINVRQYTGTQPPNFPNTGKMYFYVDVNGANSTYDYTGDVYYKDPWRGTTSATETNLRMVKKLTPGSWQAYNGTLSSVNASLNILKANMTDLGMMSGIDDGILFSAIVTPGGNLIFCPGGSVTLQANSGAGYTYQWTYNTVNIPGATAPSYVATAAGDYAVKITDPNNITATSNPILVTIIAPPAAQVSASGPLTYCTGGNLTLNAATAPGQFYQWYLNGNQIPGATQSNYNVTTHGNYTVMVKNSGCSSTSPIQVVSEGPLHVNLGTDTSFCEGTPLTLDAGYPGASYQWSDGTNGQSIQISNKNQSGTYWVSVNAGPNCQDVDTIHVTVNPLPSVIGISYVKNNNTYYFEPSGPADVNSYLWMFDDGTTDTAKKPVKVYNTPEFEVKLVVFNACGTDTVILQLPLAVSNLAAGDVNVKVYPNPASSRITLSTEGTRFSGLSVINDLGQTVYRSSLEGDRTSEDVDVSSLANGHYFIRATATDGSTINKPFNIVR